MSEYDWATDALRCYEVAIQTIREQKPLNGDGYCHCRICEKERGAAFGETCTPDTKNHRTRKVVESYPTKLGSSTVVGDSGANKSPSTVRDFTLYGPRSDQDLHRSCDKQASPNR